MKIQLFTGLLLLTVALTAVAQETSPVGCVITAYELGKNDGRRIKRLEFVPNIAEEELTNKTTRLPGSNLFVIASVFPTDESMHSAKGLDSIRLGLAVSRTQRSDAFAVRNNAVAEVTFHAFDTARVEKYIQVARKRMIVRMECWDTQIERPKAGTQQ